MKRLITILLLILSITAHAQLSGKYMTNEKMMIGGQHEITLNIDGTFKQEFGTCTGPIINNGTYTKSRDTLYLHVETTYCTGRLSEEKYVDTMIYKKRHLTSPGSWRYYKQRKKPRSNQ